MPWPWLLAIGFLIAYEAWAIATHHRTLSQMVWRVTQLWPPIMYVIGFLNGALAVHFFWRACG